MVRITEAVKMSRDKQPFPKPEKGKEEIKPSPLTLSPSTVCVSELFKEKKLVETDKTIYKRIYDSMLEVVKEVIEGQKTEEIFDTKKIVDIVEKVINQLDKSNSDIFIELVLTNSTLEDNYLYAHLVNVCILALKIGKALNMNKLELITLGTTGLLYDIGMFKLPGKIINKTSHLTNEEMDIIKTHPLKGCDWLKKVKDLEEIICTIVLQHHEKNNGQGYPQGLTKDQIHTHAKILRLVDTYEAMTHPRSWRKPFLPDKAMKEILDNEKEAYESFLLRVFLREISIYAVGSWVELSTKEIGKIVKINHKVPLRPAVEVRFDPDGFKLEKPKLINLIEHPLIYIEKSCDAKD